MARNVTVTFSDGTSHTYQGVPDDATPDQVQARAARDFAGRKVGQDASSGPSFLAELGHQVGNLVAGGVRGAGSIGATLMYPKDKITDLVEGDRGPTLSGLVTGQQPLSRNEERRQAMDAALTDLGADTSSPAFKVGKVGAEIAGTVGAGGAIANGVGRAAPALAEAAPNLLTAIRTAGMSAGDTTGAANLLLRAAGGATTGGASAGLVDPKDAGAGALLGGGLPIATKVAGIGGNALGGLVTGPAQTPETVAAIQAARRAGYVIPPTQANPNLFNRLLEGIAGKVSTAQNASAANAKVTNALAAGDVGLPADAPITVEALEALRKKASGAYADVATMGDFNAAGANLPAGANVRSGYNPLTLTPEKKVDAGDLVNAWRQANADATSYYNAYARSAQPGDLAAAKSAAADAQTLNEFLTQAVQGREAKSTDNLIADLAAGRISGAEFLSDSLRGALRANGAPSAVNALADARTQIAKTHNVERALNDATGTVDARQLAKQAAKGKPLSGGLEQAADFAARFPKAAQTPETMGSLPGTSPLDWSVGAMTPNQLLSVITLGARPAARALALSPVIQNRLVQGGAPNALAALLADPQLAALGYRAAPVALGAE